MGLLEPWVNTGVGDDYGSKYMNVPTGPTGSVVNANETDPTTGSWNLVVIELTPDDD